MARFPYLPLWTDAYLGDTRHLTTIQHGAYFLLLIVAWRTPDCALVDDDMYLARCVGMNPRTWTAHKATLMAFWDKNLEGKWQQKRLVDEWNHCRERSINNSRAGQASALKRKNRHSTNVETANQQDSNNHNHSQNHNDKISLSSNGDDTNPRSYDIRRYLSDNGLESAKRAAPGWDIYNLINLYNEWVVTKELPKSPDAAFISWCRKYTKGSLPG